MTETRVTGLMQDHDWPRTRLRAETGRADGLGSLDRDWIRRGLGLLSRGAISWVHPDSPRRRRRRGVFAGSIFFTLAALLELRESTLRLGRRAADPSWWSAAVQFVGTLLFNLSTFEAMQDGLSAGQDGRLVWAPDLFGSAAFLISGVLAFGVANRAHRHAARRDIGWTMAIVNLTGCVLFGISAVASYIVPSSGSILDLAAANWTASLGALCSLIGALLLLPRQRGAQHRSPKSLVPTEV